MAVPKPVGKCGWGKCTPSCLQMFASVWVFLGFFFFYNFVHGLQPSYTVAVLTTLERRFNLPSSQSGMLGTISILGYSVSSIFVAHFLKNSHMPRVITASALMAGVAALAYVIPHFLYGTGNPDLDLLEKSSANMTVAMPSFGLLTHFCADDQTGAGSPGGHNANGTASGQAMGAAAMMAQAPSRPGENSKLPFSLFVLAEIIHGIAGSFIWTLGIVFLDNHLSRQTSSKVMGIMFSTRILSPLVGFGMGAGFLSLYANLEDTSLTPYHPRWIGAWWLGYFICSASCLILAAVVSMFPKRLKGMKTLDEIEEQEKLRLKGKKAEEERKRRDSGTYRKGSSWWERTEDDEEEENMNVLAAKAHDLKDLPKGLCRLILNPVYITLVLGGTIDAIVFGHFIFLPKYIEVQFQKNPIEANLVAGVGACIVAGIASIVSGFLTAVIRRKGVPATIFFCLACSLITTAMTVAFFFIGCDQLPVAGSVVDGSLQTELSCNANCSCSGMKYEPVCGTDGLIYHSPCHAGCSFNVSNCGCVPSGEASGGLCDSGCHTQMIYFLVVVYIWMMLLNLYNIPYFTSIFRCVDKEDKALGVGFMTFIVGITLVPAPIIYGWVIDKACILPMPVPVGTVHGACLLYDRDKIKIYVHTLTVATKIIPCFLYLASWLLARGRFKVPDENKNVIYIGNASMREKQELIGERLASL